MPTTKGGTALDVLRNVPSVDVDIDNIVSLRGNTGVIVQINGRPSPLKPAQLGNFLAQLPADIVDKVEVIPNPSARDDPTGVAGIINIVLKQKADAGIGGGVTLGAGTTGHVDAGGNVGYQGGPWSLFGSYNFLHDNRPRREAIFRENRYLDPLTYLAESGLRERQPLANTLTGSAGLQARRARRPLGGRGIQHTRAGRIVQAPVQRSEHHARPHGHERSRHHWHGERVQPPVHARLQAHLRRQIAQAVERASLRPGQGRRSERHCLAHVVAQRHAHRYAGTRDADIVGAPHRVFGESGLRAAALRRRAAGNGYKGSLQRFPSTLDYQIFDTTLAVYRPDSTRISDFTYNQDVNAAYGMLAGELGKFQLQGGLRVERANTRFHLNTLGRDVRQHLQQLFPERAHRLQHRRRAPGEAELLDAHPSPRRHRPARPDAALRGSAQPLARQSIPEAGVHPRARVRNSALDGPDDGSGHAVLPAHARCDPNDPHDRHRGRRDEDIRERRHERRVRRRREHRPEWWIA